MDFSRLPNIAFLEIFQYLPLEESIRVGRVNKSFRQFAQLTTSHVKSLDLSEDRFQGLTDDQLGVILDLCSPNLDRIKFPSRESMGNPTESETNDWNTREWNDWNQRAAILDNHGQQLATMFANFQCPRLTDIDLGQAPIDYASFGRLIQNNPKLESLIWRAPFGGFPTNVMNGNLKKLHVNIDNDSILQTLIGRCPNLEEMDLITGSNGISASVLDQFFGSIPMAQRFSITIKSIHFESELISFWNLPLTSLSINFSKDDFNDDHLLFKVIRSFPNLQILRLNQLDPSDAAISSLATLGELEILELQLLDLGSYLTMDHSLRQFANCRKIRKLFLDAVSVSGGTLVNLLRSCPQLERIDIWDITEVANAQEAAAMVGSLAGIARRDIGIQNHSWFLELFPSDWDEEPVREAIERLEREHGIRIRIGL